MTNPPSRLALVVVLAVASLTLHAACARSGSTSPEADSFGLFSPDAGDAGTGGACVATECPAPFATCPGEDGLCTTNLTNDIDHCGSCGGKCPRKGKNGTYVCSEGKCTLSCNELTADCNLIVADGCEVPTDSDPLNCGACGKACAADVLCWRGACGCPNGYTQCGTECKKLGSDDLIWGACGNVCKAPTDPSDPAWICGSGVTPAHTQWSCMTAACGLSCKGGFGNCNNDLCLDGCEVDLKTDALNCGACGNKCAAGQTCEGGSCLCPAGTIRCDGDCVDPLTDARNCGQCGNDCPGPASASGRKIVGGSPICELGKCSYVCFPGYADCDDSVYNGCEAHLPSDPLNCGSCGTKCNTRAGQPCVVGKCLTRECDAGGVVQ